MKKIHLALLTIISFGLYALVIRHKDSGDAVTILPPASLQTTQAATLSPTDTSTATPTSTPSSTISSSPTPTPTRTPTPTPAGKYKNGTYTGSPADAFYGNIQVKAVIQNGKITNVIFLDYPQDQGHSIEINSQAMPYLKAEAIQIQAANVDIISGATDSSLAFRQSLASALSQAH